MDTAKFPIFVAMKDRFHKIISLAMAFMLLASTVSWTVEKHYCMGRLYDLALFSGADHCGMEMTPENGIHKTSCCADEVFVVNGQHDLKPVFENIRQGQKVFTLPITSPLSFCQEAWSEKPVPHEQYPPPLLTRDIHLLDRIFII